MSYTALLWKLDVTKNNQWKGMNKNPYMAADLEYSARWNIRCPSNVLLVSPFSSLLTISWKIQNANLIITCPVYVHIPIEKFKLNSLFHASCICLISLKYKYLLSFLHIFLAIFTWIYKCIWKYITCKFTDSLQIGSLQVPCLLPATIVFNDNSFLSLQYYYLNFICSI